ncbi:MAG: hydrogenase maturation nickel metallochaperone HypA [Candidatus Omnitrophica bacterium]|nr:hydrogenase maturation nickel metallochaperone HypA [Candidatus Omnitrophota bacterium]
MHEYHLVKSVIKTIEAKTAQLNTIKKISLIKITLGDLKMVTREHFTETFKEVARGTICEGAALDITQVPGDVLIVENIEGEFKKD